MDESGQFFTIFDENFNFVFHHDPIVSSGGKIKKVISVTGFQGVGKSQILSSLGFYYQIKWS